MCLSATLFLHCNPPRIDLQQPCSIKSQIPGCLYFNPAVPQNLEWILLEQQLQDFLFCISCVELEMESQTKPMLNFFILPAVCVCVCGSVSRGSPAGTLIQQSSQISLCQLKH